ncbi:D-aminoacyl-tRNA deacylase [Numidum massiliense]|uniref:D-aminoacyl-tRNA deacylase n=1 Tax=Numidum massiliense TaxID=1522315 RepID=UPI0006D555A3|nr:D-aminoacyl-tRNA deacylase [Numidum massiliense]
MRVIIQRSGPARVTVDGEVTGEIAHGLVCLVGFTHGDDADAIAYVADKIVNLRIFTDDEGKMNHSLLDSGGEILSVSQFTVYGDCRKGRRPSFTQAAAPDRAAALYDAFNERLRSYSVRVATGVFGANMQVSLTNDGPVTFIVDSK